MVAMRRLRLIVTSVARTARRDVRTFASPHRRPPWPFLFKSKGWRENGPYYEQKWEWPERDSGWNVLPGCSLKKEERRPIEIVAPDLTNFKLKPYVSYRMAEDALTTREFTAKDLFDLACKK